ncbi:Phosphatidylinositolglycan class N-domain-containing protein [Pyronema domesticum]|uniref:GPI ethanolamine phosphate transferase 1 n=1 Tax=Pyronema omphalodes (strain CBS 100304) TaxID=1076935 RepID=U4LAG0_PYROM|nr:Phosphatidylinositolglycan class N-domain-containing protein [Pyronema domesticum]CCX16400.1 Similar to GPI ethanolamine phosphate transferase 1; acc. no. Q4W9R7 [Pyronema omphalodes CBS 100304]
MARLGRLGFLAVGVVFHLIYIYSIFDIYFVSPIVSGMRPYDVDAPAPAKRLFLVVGDGLRADKCFQRHPDPDEPSVTRYLSPFIRDKVLNHGTFGVSHTRVPTESRPGHVALIAGLYEDVSAVTTGWKMNPVNFDSVFNESRHTWSWGSPDILPMFKYGASDLSRVDAWTYDEEMEDFTQDAINLDIWVFDRVKSFFEDARRDPELYALLQKDKLVFFLHLLGLDTTGHSYRPYSPEYLRNIKVVDQGLKQVHDLVEEFYGYDGKTSWVFTADHGMSDWGSHGDGHPDNTRTPLVAWGAGVKKPVHVENLPAGAKTGHEDGFSGDWGLTGVRRNDVAQADVAALMAYLVGTKFPVNSVGELPLDYLDADDETKAKAIWTNARQILEMYKVKEAQKNATHVNYKPYGSLVNIPEQLLEIETLLENGAYTSVIQKSMILIKTSLDGLRYLQTYDWLLLRTVVTLGYLGWIAYALTTVIDNHVLNGSSKPERGIFSFLFFSGILVSLYGLFFMQQSSPTYYAYALFPVVFWHEVFVRRKSLGTGIKQLVNENPGKKSKYFSLFLQTVCAIGFLEAMVTGYFYREVFTFCFVLASLAPFFYGKTFVLQNKALCILWPICCLLMSTFTLLPVIKVESEFQILLGGALMFAMGIAYMVFGTAISDGIPAGQTMKSTVINNANRNIATNIIIGIQVGLIALSMIVTSSSVRSLQAKQGLPFGNQVVGWLVLILSIVVPQFHSLYPNPHYFHHLTVLFLACSPIFIILTISYEGLFYVVFSLLLVTWTQLESRLPGATTTARNLKLGDLRISLGLLFLLQSAFFSTGNIASISSFSLDSVYRLIPIFSPFAMGALLLLKLMIPFALISANMVVLNHRAGLGSGAVFMVVTALCDVLTLNFFWLVRDEGSWLEIGTGISHFCIGGALGLFLSALEGFGRWWGKGLRVPVEAQIEVPLLEKLEEKKE